MLLDLEWLVLPFIACVVLTSLHTYLGLHVIRRKVLFVDLALAQIAALGSTVAFLRGYDPGTHESYMLALAFAGVGAVVLSLTRTRHEKVPQEAIIGLIFAIASAGSILLASTSPHGAEDLQQLMAGSLVTVTQEQVRNAAILYAALGVFHLFFRRRFLTITCAPAEAEAAGWSLPGWDFLFYVTFAFAITMSVQIAGVLLVFCLLVGPSVFATMWADRFRSQLFIGWGASLAACAIGLGLSYYYMPGPMIFCVFAAILLGSAAARGWMTSADRLRWIGRLGMGGAATIMAWALIGYLAPTREDPEHAPHGSAMADETHPSAAVHGHGVQEHAIGSTPGDQKMALKDDHENVRAKAAEALAAAGNRDAIPDLVPLVKDPSPAVREAAARALGRLEAKEAVPLLVEGLGVATEDEWVPLEFAKTLVLLGEVRGLDALARQAAEAEARLVRDEALTALLAASDMPAPAAPDPSPRETLVRWAAWRAACGVEGPRWDPTRKRFEAPSSARTHEEK